VVPDSSIFTARKPIKMIYSYNKLSISSSNIIRELQNMKIGYSRMNDVSMTKDQSLLKERYSHVIEDK
jgi:translation initiation factor 2B subunit (eIF-2B alpha/beta/delta family)